MDFLLNFLSNAGLNASNPAGVLWWLFTHGGFIFVIWVILKGLSEIWLDWRNNVFASNLKWTYLAIDVPKDNEQSPKAVEQIFNQVWGAAKAPNFQEKWWKGYFQPNFSFELVSVEGYIQYIIRTPTMFCDLVEAAVYAQYPEAQIAEIEDYTKDFTPDNFRGKDYDFWGGQIGLVNDEVYPIRTYPLFEHSIAQVIVDPMAAMLEIFSRLGKGEQGWLQINIIPVSDKWKEKSDNEVKKLLGKKVETKKTAIDKALDVPSAAATKMGDIVFGPIGALKEEEKEEPWRMLAMSPGERAQVEGVERKSEKIGFKTKIRYIYWGQRGSFSKTRGVSGVIGALRQFSLLNSNGFAPVAGTTTKSNNMIDKLRDSRIYKIQRRILKNYKLRSQTGGKKEQGDILNVEELASIYHFPFITTVTPTLKRAEAKRAEAPFTLPIEEAGSKEKSAVVEDKGMKAGPPENLPV